MPQTRFIQGCVSVICVLLIIYLAAKVSFLLAPLVSLFKLLIVPLMLSVFFYYLLRPVVVMLGRQGMKPGLAVPLIYVAIAGLLTLFALWVWPPLREQLVLFVNNAPELVENVMKQADRLRRDDVVGSMLPGERELWARATEYLNRFLNSASGYLSGFFGFVSDFVVVLAIVPVILFYMLKEGGKIGDKLLALIPRRYRMEGKETLTEIDDALGSFILTRVLINLILGAMMYVGFLIIGLPYSLLLTFVSIVLNFIPYFGALLGAIPVVIVAYIESPTMALWSVVIIVIAQQIQDNFLSPLVYGRRLEIHPVTIIVLLLLGGDLAGIMGMLLVIPFYLIVKIVFIRLYRLFWQEKMEDLVD